MPRRGNAFSRCLGRLVLNWYGFRIVGAIPDAPKMVILGVPHTSNMDGVITFAAGLKLGLSLSVMMKDSMFRGLWNRPLKWLGGLPIDRSRSRGVVEATVDAFNAAEKLLLVIAPEGTRSAPEKWKTGFYHAAVGARVPILCGAINYRSKQVDFTPAFHPTGNFEQDWPELIQRFRGGYPQHPERASKPIADLLGLPWQAHGEDG